MDIDWDCLSVLPIYRAEDEEDYWMTSEGERKRQKGLSNLPNPGLTWKEQSLSPHLLTLVTVMKKCESAKKWDLISTDFLIKLLKDSEKEVDRVLPMISYRRARFSTGKSFTDFHLQWDLQGFRSNFIMLWLTYQAENNLLEEFIKDQDLKDYEGMLVAVKWEVDQHWYRGCVREIDREKGVRIYYLDHGYEELHHADTIRRIPASISRVEGMSFPATLADVDVDLERKRWTHLKFITKMRGFPDITCRIKDLLQQDQTTRKPYQRKAVVFLGARANSKELGNSNKRYVTVNNIVRHWLMSEKEQIMIDFDPDRPTPEEISLLVQKNLSPTTAIELLKASSVDPQVYRICHFENPDKLYVDSESGSKEAVEHFLTIQQFYAAWNLDDFNIRTPRVFLNRPYVWFDPNSKDWHRVIVIRVDTPPQTCSVLRVDIGDCLLVHIHHMMEINPEFTTWPGRAIRAHLVHIRPGGRRPGWSHSAVKAIKKVVEGSKFWGVALATESKDIGNLTSSGMALINQIKKFRGGYTLQAQLVTKRLAEAVGFVAGNPHLAFLHYEGTPNYDPFHGASNADQEGNYFPVDKKIRPLDDFSIVSSFTESISRSEEELEFLDRIRIFQGDPNVQPVFEKQERRGSLICYCGHGCKSECLGFQKLKFPDFHTMEPRFRYRKFVGYCPAEREVSAGPFTSTFGKYLAAIKICHTEGPGAFYIQMASKGRELYKVMKDISEAVRDRDDLLVDMDCVGEIVAAFVMDDEMICNWHRAYVSKVLVKSSIAKVVLIDVGLKLNVPLKNIRYLPESFSCIPPYCRRAHLNARPKCLRSGRWTPKQNEIFSTYIKLNSHSAFLAWKASDEVELLDFGQEVWYDRGKKQWWNGGNISPDFPIVRQDETDKKLLYHLLHSIGINFCYETAERGKNQFEFEGLEKLFL